MMRPQRSQVPSDWNTLTSGTSQNDVPIYKNIITTIQNNEKQRTEDQLNDTMLATASLDVINQKRALTEAELAAKKKQELVNEQINEEELSRKKMQDTFEKLSQDAQKERETIATMDKSSLMQNAIPKLEEEIKNLKNALKELFKNHHTTLNDARKELVKAVEEKKITAVRADGSEMTNGQLIAALSEIPPAPPLPVVQANLLKNGYSGREHEGPSEGSHMGFGIAMNELRVKGVLRVGDHNLSPSALKNPKNKAFLNLVNEKLKPASEACQQYKAKERELHDKEQTLALAQQKLEAKAAPTPFHTRPGSTS